MGKPLSYTVAIPSLNVRIKGGITIRDPPFTRAFSSFSSESVSE